MSDKATWWSVTAFGDEILLLEDISGYPHWVATVYGGREECPETKSVHFQGALQCYSQQRLAKLKSWLPTAHFEIARKVEALKKYAMKSETAISEKKFFAIRKNFFQLTRYAYSYALKR